MNHETWTQIIKNDIIPPPMLRKKDWIPDCKMRMLELLRKESQWTLGEGIIYLMNHHVEHPWRTPVTKRMMKTEVKRSWEQKVKPWNDLDESSRRYNAEKLGNQEKKDETNETKNLKSLRNKELNLLDETRIRITLCLSFTN